MVALAVGFRDIHSPCWLWLIRNGSRPVGTGVRAPLPACLYHRYPLSWRHSTPHAGCLLPGNHPQQTVERSLSVEDHVASLPHLQSLHLSTGLVPLRHVAGLRELRLSTGHRGHIPLTAGHPQFTAGLKRIGDCRSPLPQFCNLHSGTDPYI